MFNLRYQQYSCNVFVKALKTEAHTKWHIKTYYYLRLSDVDQICMSFYATKKTCKQFIDTGIW